MQSTADALSTPADGANIHSGTRSGRASARLVDLTAQLRKWFSKELNDILNSSIAFWDHSESINAEG